MRVFLYFENGVNHKIYGAEVEVAKEIMQSVVVSERMWIIRRRPSAKSAANVCACGI